MTPEDQQNEYDRQLGRLREHDVVKFSDMRITYFHPLPDMNEQWAAKADAPYAWQVPCVYFVQAESGGPIKVGWCGLYRLSNRLSALQVGNPETLVVRAALNGGAGLEKAFHIEFADLRIRENGEWFRNERELAKIAHAVSSDGVGYMFPTEAEIEERLAKSEFSGQMSLDKPRLKSRKPPRVLPVRGESHEQVRAA